MSKWWSKRSLAEQILASVGIGLSIAALIGSINLCFPWIEAHPGAAGWLQAVGTIGALAIAIWLPRASLRRRKSSLKATSARVVEYAWNVFVDAYSSRENVSRASDYLNRFSVVRWQIALDALERIPLFELDEPTVALAVVDMHNAITEEFARLKNVRDAMVNGRGDLLAWRLALQSMEANSVPVDVAASAFRVWTQPDWG